MKGSEVLNGPAYRITTERLVIRCLQPLDASMMSLSIQQSNECLIPWLPWANEEPAELNDRIMWIRKCRGHFDLGLDFTYGIFNPDETIFLGGTGLHTRLGFDAREIGYWIHKDYQNQGLATEVAAALTRVAFDIDHVNRVEIHCDPRNVHSSTIPRKLGFIHEATLHNRHMDSTGSLRDAMIWTLFLNYYPNSLPARVKIQVYDAINRRLL